MNSATRPDPEIKQWATPSQARYIDAVIEHGSERAAARALGVNFTTVHGAITRAKVRADAGRVYWDKVKSTTVERSSPLSFDPTRGVPAGEKLRGRSNLYKEGQAEPVLEWIKTSADAEAQRAIQLAAVQALAAEIPRVAPLPGPADGSTEASLCNLYTLTDSHVGMLAWHREGGADWDLKIAEATLVGCFERMVASSPPARVGVVNQLGDFLHYDSAVSAITPLHGHILDADGRMPKMAETAVRILRRVVDFALSRHELVVVLLAEGNHDITSSVWLRVLFRALYENEPRVQVIDSELPYYVHQHGECLLAFHHGHLKKNDQLPILFASQFPVAWGSTTKRYAHTGHRHHTDEKEHSGMTVHQHPTLAARDAYAARGGWIAHRQVTALTYHARFGEVARNTVTPEMLAS